MSKSIEEIVEECRKNFWAADKALEAALAQTPADEQKVMEAFRVWRNALKRYNAAMTIARGGADE